MESASPGHLLPADVRLASAIVRSVVSCLPGGVPGISVGSEAGMSPPGLPSNFNWGS